MFLLIFEASKLVLHLVTPLLHPKREKVFRIVFGSVEIVKFDHQTARFELKENVETGIFEMGGFHRVLPQETPCFEVQLHVERYLVVIEGLKASRET